MANYTYAQILKQAKKCYTNVNKEYKTGMSSNWAYYFAKALLTPKKDIKQIKIGEAKNPQGQYISRTLTSKEYLNLAKTFTKDVEKLGRLPDYTTYKKIKLNAHILTIFFARCLISYDSAGKYKAEKNINSKWFTKPTENPNEVFQLWKKYIKTTPKQLDDVCEYMMKHFDYEFYFDDKKSNEQVIKTKKGNCTDLLQMLTNMADALGYDWEVIHTKCRQSGTGHVYGRFKKKGTSSWFVRDIACITDESRYCIWCEVPNGGTLLAKNPSWFLSNRNR